MEFFVEVLGFFLLFAHFCAFFSFFAPFSYFYFIFPQIFLHFSREERRWIDKQNKVTRDKKRKDEIKRIRKLVEIAYGSDPRIQKFKQDEKLKKNAVKLAKQEEQRKIREAEEQVKKFFIKNFFFLKIFYFFSCDF